MLESVHHSSQQKLSAQKRANLLINDQRGQMVDFTRPSSRRYHHLQSEETWELPDHLGIGNFQKIELRNSLWIGVGQARLKNLMREEVYDGVPGVTLIFCLTGSLRNWNPCFPKGFKIPARTGALCFSPDPAVNREIGTDEILQKVILKIPLEQVGLLENRQLEQAIRDEIPFLDSRPLCAGMQAALFQVLHYPFPANSRWLYLEAKALELIAYWLCSDTKAGTASTETI